MFVLQVRPEANLSRTDKSSGGKKAAADPAVFGWPGLEEAFHCIVDGKTHNVRMRRKSLNAKGKEI